MNTKTNLKEITDLKARFAIAFVACAMLPQHRAPLNAAIDAVIFRSFPDLEKLATQCLRRYGKRASQLSGDVVSNWTIRIIEKNLAESYDATRASPKTFFGRVMQNVASETVRSTGRRADHVELPAALFETKASALDLLIDDECLELARQRYLTLPKAQKRAIKSVFPFLDEDDPDASAASPKTPKTPPTPAGSRATAWRAGKAIEAYIQLRTQ